MPQFSISMVHHSYGTSHADVKIDDLQLRVDFSESETAELLALAHRAFARQQASIASAIAEAVPPALPSPDAIDAEWNDA